MLGAAACVVVGFFGFARRGSLDHSIRFALAWLQLIIGWSAFFALGARLKRYR